MARPHAALSAPRMEYPRNGKRSSRSRLGVTLLGLALALVITGATSASALALPVWEVNSNVLKTGEEAKVAATGWVTFSIPSQSVKVKCELEGEEKLKGGAPGKDSFSSAAFEIATCKVEEPVGCTLFQIGTDTPWQTTLLARGGIPYDIVKNFLIFFEFNNNPACPKNLLTIRGDVEAEWLNGAPSQFGFPATALGNTNLKSQLNALAKLWGTLNVELGEPTETLTVQEETAKEEKERETKESKEKEEQEKEGNPLILPVPTAQAPLTFTSTSPKFVLESVGKSKIECKEYSASGEFTGAREGIIDITFQGCKDTGLGLACHGLGDPSETIMTSGSIELVDLEKAKLTLGVEVAPQELEIECGTAKVTIKGSIIGEVSGIESGKKTKAGTVIFKEEKGKQTIKECHLTKKFCEGKKFSLEVKFGKAFEEAGAEMEEKLTFAKEVVFDF